MTQLRVEMLTPARVTELWGTLEPLFEASCGSNEVSAFDISPSDIYLLSQTDQCVLFAGFKAGKLGMSIAIQFNETNGHKGADVIALGGSSFLAFKAAFWEPILQWLKANAVTYVDAYANERLAKVYKARCGFDKTCVMLRMEL